MRCFCVGVERGLDLTSCRRPHRQFLKVSEHFKNRMSIDIAGFHLFQMSVPCICMSTH